MSDGTIQFTNHACIPGDRPFTISSSSSSLSLSSSSSSSSPTLHSSLSNTKQLLIGPSTSIYHQSQHQQQHQHPHQHQHQHQQHNQHHHHHQQQLLGLQYHPPPQQQQQQQHQRLETLDPVFPVPSTHHIGLLPMPVAYEEFQYALPNIELPNQGVCGTIDSNDLQLNNLGLIYQTYPTGASSDAQDHHPSLSNPWNVSPTTRNQLSSSHDINQGSLLNDLFQEPVQQQQPPMLYPPHPSSNLLEFNPTYFPNQSPFSTHIPHGPSCNSQSVQTAHPLPHPPTPPPLLDPSEQDLLSSFLNIFGDSNTEYDFDPQGMPEGMPVLGELKRRLEAREDPIQHLQKREADEMGRQVETRLKISDSDSACPHTRRPSLQSFQTTSGSLSSSSESHHLQESSFLSRKKAKTTNTPEPIESVLHPPEGNRRYAQELEDINMRSWNYDCRHRTDDWPGSVVGKTVEGSQTDCHTPSQLSKPYGQFPGHSGPLSSVLQSPNILNSSSNINRIRLDERSSQQDSRKGLDDQMISVTSPTTPNSNSRRVSSSKRTSKSGKTTHMVSEQRRRNAIQGGFGNLVEILRAGETVSGISIAIAEPSHHNTNPDLSSGNNPHHNLKPKTRGRGRRGEIETGASKSVVLERAAEFVQWMSDGNLALKNEVNRIESILRNHGIEL